MHDERDRELDEGTYTGEVHHIVIVEVGHASGGEEVSMGSAGAAENCR